MKPSGLVSGLLLMSMALIAQAPQEPPTFRSGVSTIDVDVLVTDREGQPVKGLRKEDFTLLEDGDLQPITSFSFVDLPIQRSITPRGIVRPESDIATNTDAGRTYVLLINLIEGQDPQRTRLLARRFIDEAIGPNDQAAVIHVLDTMSKAQGFTRKRSLLLASVDRTAEPTSVGDPTYLSFQILEEVSERLGRINGRRKAVVWFNAPTFFAPEDTVGLPPDPMDRQRWFAMRDALRAANRNNVAIYPVSIGLSTGLGLEGLKSMGGVRALAEDTGGEAIVNTNNFSPAFERLVRDNSTYYLLGYEPRVEHRDGKFHALTVRVKNRPELTVRARRGYFAPEADVKTGSRPRIVEGLSADTAEAVRMPASVGGLGMDLFVVPFKGTGNRASVVFGAHLRGADLALGSGQRIEIAYQAVTPEGTLTPGAFKVFTLDFTPESRATVGRAGLAIIDRLELPHGRHQVRFAVHQPDGKTGSVVADVDVPDYRAPLVMSGIVIASRQTARRTLMSDAILRSILSLDPTTARRFGRDDEIIAYVEVYWDPREPVDDFITNATVTPVERQSGRRVALSRVSNEPGRIGYVTRVRVGDLGTGDYLLAIETSTGRRTASQRMPFSVSAD
jgi:VWFA-related protein